MNWRSYNLHDIRKSSLRGDHMGDFVGIVIAVGVAVLGSCAFVTAAEACSGSVSNPAGISQQSDCGQLSGLHGRNVGVSPRFSPRIAGPNVLRAQLAGRSAPLMSGPVRYAPPQCPTTLKQALGAFEGGLPVLFRLLGAVKKIEGLSAMFEDASADRTEFYRTRPSDLLKQISEAAKTMHLEQKADLLRVLEECEDVDNDPDKAAAQILDKLDDSALPYCEEKAFKLYVAALISRELWTVTECHAQIR